jgi:hypothetical protein
MIDNNGKRMPPLEAARHYLNSESEITFGKVDMRLMIEGLVAMIINMESEIADTKFAVTNMTNSLQSRIEELSRDMPDTSAERMYDAIVAYANAIAEFGDDGSTDDEQLGELESIFNEMIESAAAFVDPPRDAEAVMIEPIHGAAP